MKRSIGEVDNKSTSDCELNKKYDGSSKPGISSDSNAQKGLEHRPTDASASNLAALKPGTSSDSNALKGLEHRPTDASASNLGTLDQSKCTDKPPAVLHIQPITRFNGKFPFFRQPMEVGCISFDRDRNVYLDKRMLKFLYDTREISVRYDLQHGYETFEKCDDNVKQRLNNIMKWIVGMKKHFQLETNDEGDQKIKSLNTDFIAWRGHFTKIMCTPYEQREGWMMAVTKFRGTFYISEVETKENEARRKNMSDREKEMTYWGYKFEQYMTSVDGLQEPNTQVPVNNSEAYCCVVRTRLNKHSMIYSGEVDCCVNDPKLRPPANYVELKTNRILYAPNNKRNFRRFKLLKWWAQSFLVGIPTVIGGFRDDEGIVLEVERFNTFKIPEIAKQDGSWNASVCMNFCDYFLNYVKSQVTKDDPRIVYLFERRPGSQEITYTIEKDPVHQFIPEWFISQFI